VNIFFLNIYYHASLENAYTSEVRAPAMLLLLIVGNQKLRGQGVLQWLNGRTIFCRNWSVFFSKT